MYPGSSGEFKDSKGRAGIRQFTCSMGWEFTPSKDLEIKN
jgi:hypothetical protein